MKQVAILLLAAGASTRMQGRDKLMEPVAAAQPLLRERTCTALATGCPVYVALPPCIGETAGRWECLTDLGATCVEVLKPEQGMSASLTTLVSTLPKDIDGALVLPADMPDITLADLRASLAAFDGHQVVRGASGKQPGHPVIFPAHWFGRLMRLSGDKGARDLLRDAGHINLIPLPGNNALTDLDTPEDWQKWRKSRT